MGCSNYKFQFESEEDESTDSLRIAVSGQIFYYHPDHLGTNTIISNSYGTIHQYFFNLPFGETMVEGTTNSSYPLDYKFNGKEFDVESGLYYYGARYYDPRLSVWLSVDPLVEKYPNFTGFAYCGNNPIVYFDPNGLFRTKFGVTKTGDVRQLEESNSEPDELYAITDDNRIINGIKPEIVRNKAILPELAKDQMSTPYYDAAGTLLHEEILSTATSSSKNDMSNIFLFVAKNTNVEWSLYTSSEKGKTNYSIGTFGWDDLAPSISYFNIREENVSSMIHSHPNEKTQRDEVESMSLDRALSPTVHYNYYMYGAKLQNFYEVTKGGKSKFIERISTPDQINKYMK